MSNWVADPGTLDLTLNKFQLCLRKCNDWVFSLESNISCCRKKPNVVSGTGSNELRTNVRFKKDLKNGIYCKEQLLSDEFSITNVLRSDPALIYFESDSESIISVSSTSTSVNEYGLCAVKVTK